MTIQIRQSTRADIPALQRLIPESARALSVGFYTPEEIELAVAHVFGVATQLIDDGTYFVAEADGQIVGCGGWSRRKTLCGGDQMKTAAEDPLGAGIVGVYLCSAVPIRGQQHVGTVEAIVPRDGRNSDRAA